MRIEITHVVCGKCKVRQPVSGFARNRTKKNGLADWCKTCQRIMVDRYRDQARRNTRHLALRKNYGISLEDYEGMLASQGGRCAICGRSDPGDQRRRNFAVDHDHTSGRVRGLLCGLCNTGLGQLQDSEEILEAAISYLRKSRS